MYVHVHVILSLGIIEYMINTSRLVNWLGTITGFDWVVDSRVGYRRDDG